jgi:hypothetical protein
MFRAAVEISPRTLRILSRELSRAFVVPQRQFPRIVFHGLILAFIIGGFWLLDSLKDPVLANIVGIEYQPTAKFISVLTTLSIVCCYDYLSTLVSKPNLFHIVATVFGLTFVVLSALLGDPATGTALCHSICVVPICTAIIVMMSSMLVIVCRL